MGRRDQIVEGLLGRGAALDLQDKLSTLSDGWDRRGRPVRVATTRRTRSLEETGAALAMPRARTRRKYAAAAASAQWP